VAGANFRQKSLKPCKILSFRSNAGCALGRREDARRAVAPAIASSEFGTHKTVKAMFGSNKTVKARFGTHQTGKARFGTNKIVKARFGINETVKVGLWGRTWQVRRRGLRGCSPLSPGSSSLLEV